jgi:hypothetical protein
MLDEQVMFLFLLLKERFQLSGVYVPTHNCKPLNRKSVHDLLFL